MNPLEEHPRLRKALYKAYWLIGVLLGAVPVAYAAVLASVPTWALVSMALYGYFGVALGFTADKNTYEGEHTE